MADWPATLPQTPQDDNYQEDWPKNIIRTDMDAGPAKVRKRFTAGIDNFKCSILLTLSQVTTLRTFFTTTVDYGATSFNFPHPRTGATITVRFVNPPSIISVGPKDYKANMELEQLP
jgi:hypothetical protein